ncbi:hypothetical protein [Actinoplanes rectilineatus]|uniref:hypothetical protein n=1 Tax=Actinoplanes rectilineatus TaxID=113571 RepID=UPI0012F7532F|nr:hypothetical protein [Actinoplanes rectilineatus]
MTVTDTDPPGDTPAAKAERVAAALLTQETFNRDQVAWLTRIFMGWGYDLGYEDGQRDEHALANIAAMYTYTGSFSAEATMRGVKKLNRRQAADAASRIPRIGAYTGGPVPWDEDPQDDLWWAA